MTTAKMEPSVGTKRRFLELDIARAIPLLMLPFVHFYEEAIEFGFVSERVLDGGRFLLFLCALGPSVFMLFLGVNVVFSSHNSPVQLAKRGLKTIAYYCLLNIIRTLLPALIVSLNGFPEEWHDGLKWTLASDILFFAGCAFLFFALMKKLHGKPYIMLLLSLLLLTLNTLLPPLSTSSDLLQAFLGNFFYINETSCFPLLSWLVFPVIGYCIGPMIQQLKTKPQRDFFYLRLFLVCASGLAASCVCAASYGLDPFVIAASPVNAYQTDLLNVVLDVCMAGVWTSAVYFLSSLIRSPKVATGASRVSDAILVFYCVQWVFVGWVIYAMLLMGYGESVMLSDGAFVLLSIGIWMMSLVIALLIKRASRLRKQARASV